MSAEKPNIYINEKWPTAPPPPPVTDPPSPALSYAELENENEKLRELLTDLFESCVMRNFPSDDEDFELLHQVNEALK